MYFFDVDFTTKAQYSINHASTITYGYKNQTASVDNIYSNPIITNYRNLLFSDGINFTTLFPYHQINYDHFIFDTKNKNTIIFNLNYKISNNAIGTQVTNSNEITLTSYNSIDKDETVSLFLFYEKKIPFKPFTFSSNLSYDINKMQYFQNNLPNDFKSNIVGGYLEISSKFKNSPIHFNAGYRFSFEKYLFSTIESNVSKQQPYANLKGALSNNIFWEIENLYSIFKIDNLERSILYVNPEIRYSNKNSNWEFNITGTNILNLNNNSIAENLNRPGFSERRITAILEGNILVGAKIKF